MTRNARIGRIAGGAALLAISLWTTINSVVTELGIVGGIVSAVIAAAGTALIATGAIRPE